MLLEQYTGKKGSLLIFSSTLIVESWVTFPSQLCASRAREAPSIVAFHSVPVAFRESLITGSHSADRQAVTLS